MESDCGPRGSVADSFLPRMPGDSIVPSMSRYVPRIPGNGAERLGVRFAVLPWRVALEVRDWRPGFAQGPIPSDLAFLPRIGQLTAIPTKSPQSCWSGP